MPNELKNFLESAFLDRVRVDTNEVYRCWSRNSLPLATVLGCQVPLSKESEQVSNTLTQFSNVAIATELLEREYYENT